MEQDIYLDKDATIARIRNMTTQSDIVKSVLDESNNIMDDLTADLSGDRATKLQKSYHDVSTTFIELRKYFQNQIETMQQLTTNIKNTDEL